MLTILKVGRVGMGLFLAIAMHLSTLQSSFAELDFNEESLAGLMLSLRWYSFAN